MTMKVEQASSRPTNKVLAFTIGMSIAKIIEVAATWYWPFLDDPIIWAPLPLLVEFVAPAVVGFIAAYQTRDEVNVDWSDHQRGV